MRIHLLLQGKLVLSSVPLVIEKRIVCFLKLHDTLTLWIVAFERLLVELLILFAVHR